MTPRQTPGPAPVETARSAPRRRETALVAVGALLWLATTALAWLGQWFAALFVTLVLMSTYAALGIARDGRLDRKLLVFPVLAWLAIWAGSFGLAQHYAVRFADRPPDFTILGFHPSFAWILLAYWLVGTTVMMVGFYWQRDSWLPEERWQEFLRNLRPPPNGSAD